MDSRNSLGLRTKRTNGRKSSNFELRFPGGPRIRRGSNRSELRTLFPLGAGKIGIEKLGRFACRRRRVRAAKVRARQVLVAALSDENEDLFISDCRVSSNLTYFIQFPFRSSRIQSPLTFHSTCNPDITVPPFPSVFPGTEEPSNRFRNSPTGAGSTDAPSKPSPLNR